MYESSRADHGADFGDFLNGKSALCGFISNLQLRYDEVLRPHKLADESLHYSTSVYSFFVPRRPA